MKSRPSRHNQCISNFQQESDDMAERKSYHNDLMTLRICLAERECFKAFYEWVKILECL